MPRKTLGVQWNMSLYKTRNERSPLTYLMGLVIKATRAKEKTA